jgi:RHS repeat-associated protein
MLRRTLATAGTAALIVPALTGMAGPSGSGPGGPAHLRPVPAQKPVPVHAVPAHKVKVPVMRAWHRPRVTWPPATTSSARITARHSITGAPLAAVRRNGALAMPSAGSRQAGSLPVWVGPADLTAQRSASGPMPSAPGQVSVAMMSRKAAAAAGVSGVLFTLGRGDGLTASAGLHVSLDYRSFAFAGGGDFAGRLRLVALPACALTTPQIAACRRQTPLASANDVSGFRLGANVTIPASPGQAVARAGSGSAGGAASRTSRALTAPGIVLAATTASDGSGGSFSATPLSEAGTWQAGGSSGAFTYSYPIAVPPVPGGLAPQISLDYNSQAVDGLTSSTNNQASWIGDGWDYSPGFVERSYQSCEQNPAGPTKTGDLCWSPNNVTTLSLNGQDTTLVQDATTGDWHAESDNGEKISFQTGTGSNGTHDDDYWVITDTSGTSYYFGLNQLPGFASGDTATNSAWTVPVYSTASGQPCFSATFSSSKCTQAWRWNLDYETDANGNAIAFFYNTQTNSYAADNGTTATATYVRAGALSKIEYGLRAGQVYGTNKAAAEVDFTSVTTRTDVPTGTTGDLACSSGAACDVVSPTFWSKFQLSTIATESLKGTTMAPADSWALHQTFPSTGDGTTDPPMWLSTIIRTGKDGTSVALPPVTFAGIPEANRVETAADLSDGYSIIDRMRMTSVTSETGGVTKVSYDSPPASCTSGNFPAEDANTTLCYPDYWTPPGASAPVKDWFNKYVVMGVTQSNTVGGTTPVTTTYCYGTAANCESGAAWHYDDDSLTRSAQRTWDQWRGFGTVTTETGASPDPVTKTTDTFFRGMDGDHQSSGPNESVPLTDTRGDTVTDSSQFAGVNFEHIVYNGIGGNEVTDSITIPWSSAATATQSQPAPLPSLTSHLTGTAETKTYTPGLSGGGTRESDTTYTHDSMGRITTQSDVPDTSDASESTCKTTTYAQNTSLWILDLASEVSVVSVPCTATPVLPADAVSDTRYFYDGATSLTAAPTAGNVTKTQLATSYSGSTPTFTTQSTSVYDEYGRVTSATDADSRTTKTVYTPATGAEPTSVAVTDPMLLTTITAYDPVRDLPVTITNPAGLVTSEAYDALGRLTSVWKPGHAMATAPADRTFSYTVSATAPSVITTKNITPTGTYLPSETLYDSLGRQVETQAQTPDGGREVTDTSYNSDGWHLVDSDSYFTTGVPSGTLVGAPDDQVPSQTGYFYDGDGRVLRAVSYKFATETFETDTAYGGNFTTVTPPAGGTPETTFTNGLGKTSAIYQYHAGVPADPADPAADYDATSYTYTPAQQLGTITDAAGNKWTYSYDLSGNQLSEHDPDTGTTASTYDAAGQLMTSTDARGKQLSYVYDLDGRKTFEYDTTGGQAESGTDELSAWTYDTLSKGQLTKSVAFSGGTTGTSYTQGITGYNAFGLPSGTDTVISGGPLAGTYKRGLSYNAFDDEETSYSDSAAGGLPLETVNTGYDAAGNPVSAGSSLWSYVSALSYTELGQPHQYAFGPTTQPAWLLNTYDQQTNRLTSSETQTGVSPVTVDSTAYAYDEVGNITSEADTPASGPAQVQCFQYDYLARLTQAWAQGAAGCAATPSQAAEGGAAPYWNSYTYNTQNDLTKEVATPPTGSATTTSYSYPAPGASAVQPHAMQSSGPAGAPTTSYGYNLDGDTTSITGPSSSKNLTWNDADQLASVSTTGTGAGTTSYVYDADGNLLLQTDPGSVTLYLPDEQIVENTATSAVSGTRFYTIGGVTIASRSSAGTIDYLTGNQQGTATISIDSASLAVTRRYFDPNGNPVGTPPPSWQGSQGFVGGTTDPATGFTNLGAREFSPVTGAFISPDSILNTEDPQDLNPYAYAADNPSTMADPSGQMPCVDNICGSYSYLEHHAKAIERGVNSTPTWAPIWSGTSILDGPPSAQCALELCAVHPPLVVHKTSDVRSFTPHQCTGACNWGNPENNALVGSGATLTWFQRFSIGRHRIGRPQYLAARPWAQDAVDFGRSGTTRYLGYGGLVAGAGLNYLQFRGQGDSVDRATLKTAGATAIGAGVTSAFAAGGAAAAGPSAAAIGEVIGGSLGITVPVLGEFGLSEAGGAFIGGIIGGFLGNGGGSYLMNKVFGW